MRARGRYGFTLIEMIVVLGIIAIILGVATPMIHGYLKGADLRLGSEGIMATLRSARSAAIQYGYGAEFLVVFPIDNTNDDERAYRAFKVVRDVEEQRPEVRA